MKLNGFISGGSDEDLLKSLPTEGISEDLVKAMDKAGLVQRDVQVTGKNGQVFTRKQWVKASDLKATDKAPVKQATPTEPDDANKKPSTLTSTEVKDSSGTVIGTIDAVTLKSGKTVFQAKGTNGRSDTYAFTDGGKKEAEKFLKDSAKQEPPKEKVRKIKDSGDIDNGFKAINRNFGKEKGIYNAIAATNGAYTSADRSSGFQTPITILVAKNVKTDDFLNQVKKEFGFIPKHKISSGNSSDSHLVTFEAEEFYNSSDDAHKLTASKPETEIEKKGTTDKAAFEKIQGMKGYESQTGLVHGDYIYAEHDDDGDYNFTKMKRVDFEAGNSDEGTEMTPQQVLDDIKKPNIDHNTGTAKPEKKEMLQDYFSGNHGHATGKDAISTLLGKGYTRADIMSEAEKQGVTWKKNDHEGVNWMRASMAVQKHLQGVQK